MCFEPVLLKKEEALSCCAFEDSFRNAFIFIFTFTFLHLIIQLSGLKYLRSFQTKATKVIAG